LHICGDAEHGWDSNRQTCKAPVLHQIPYSSLAAYLLSIPFFKDIEEALCLSTNVPDPLAIRRSRSDHISFTKALKNVLAP
jgi:hypothetical protein